MVGASGSRTVQRICSGRPEKGGVVSGQQRAEQDPDVTPIAGLKPVRLARPEPPSSEVARALLDYILSGQVGPGQKLPSERQLSDALGVGRSVVREGIKSLGLLGLLEFRHGGGTYVRSSESDLLPRAIEWGLLLGERRVTDLVEARQHLEVLLAELAAVRRTDTQLSAIRAAKDRMDEARTTEQFVAADVDFHLAVATASNNSALANIHSSIASLLRVWIHRNIEAAGSFDRSRREHAPILDAIRDRDPVAAASAARAHMSAAGKRLRATIDKANTARFSDGH
ncbi:FadR family transcriptional regulator [Myceligenerans sp. TRM 65318]|uniref:FadR family transcriptional regulator n=1 Tax=Myceligenerans pegani TaxID=2776917 RepID=A0ABR9N5Y4_9MICO|nr:FadR family transcriptional regulator [Myceligenerans sp. TRM 65318]MBE3020815.1 FadR family transcriptional regulator [Myceligenerans sp. TRM 65318]